MGGLRLGVDVGYGHTKALSSTGVSVLFPSAVGGSMPIHSCNCTRLDQMARSFSSTT